MTINVIWQFAANGLGFAISVLAAYLMIESDYIIYILACSIAVLGCIAIERGMPQFLVLQKNKLDSNEWHLRYNTYKEYVNTLSIVLLLISFILFLNSAVSEISLALCVLVILILSRSQNILNHSNQSWPAYRKLLILPNVLRIILLLTVGLIISYPKVQLEYLTIGTFLTAIICLIFFFYQNKSRRISKPKLFSIYNFKAQTFDFSGSAMYVALLIVAFIVRAEQILVSVLFDEILAAGLLAMIALGSVVSVASTGVQQFLITTKENRNFKNISRLILFGLVIAFSLAFAISYFDYQIVRFLYPDQFIIAAKFLPLIILSHSLGLAFIVPESELLKISIPTYASIKLFELFMVAIIAPLLMIYTEEMLWFFVTICISRILSGVTSTYFLFSQYEGENIE